MLVAYFDETMDSMGGVLAMEDLKYSNPTSAQVEFKFATVPKEVVVCFLVLMLSRVSV